MKNPYLVFDFKNDKDLNFHKFYDSLEKMDR